MQKQESNKKNSIIDLKQLLEAGAHFGHQTNRWNPKMSPYIFTARNNIHVIDLQLTIKLIKKAYRFIKALAEKNGTILFIGTKKQACEAISFEAQRCDMPWINKRWLGGILTNHKTLLKSISTLTQLEQMYEQNIFDTLPKKEKSVKTKKLAKLTNYLSGIKTMKRLPDAVFIVDTLTEHLAVLEAVKLNIPIIGITDTNSDPDHIDYPIPSNDDAIKTIKLLCQTVADGIIEGRQQVLSPIETDSIPESTEPESAESPVSDAPPASDASVSLEPVPSEPPKKVEV